MLPDPKDPAYVGALIYFHYAAEALSFSKAAEVLRVTPSAVSHRISALETALGKRLFERGVRQVHLTQDGAELAGTTQRLWAELRQVTDSLRQQPVLRVSVGPYISSTWLMPRLRNFEKRHPDLRIDLFYKIGRPDPKAADVSIMWADAIAPPENGTLLFDTDCVPVAAPEREVGREFWQGSLPPIHYRDRSVWRHWLKGVGAPLSFAERGEVLEEPNLVLETASYGRGIAIGFLPFIETFTSSGRLAIVHDQVIRADQGYWLVINEAGNPMSLPFAEWVIETSRLK